MWDIDQIEYRIAKHAKLLIVLAVVAVMYLGVRGFLSLFSDHDACEYSAPTVKLTHQGMALNSANLQPITPDLVGKLTKLAEAHGRDVYTVVFNSTNTYVAVNAIRSQTYPYSPAPCYDVWLWNLSSPSNAVLVVQNVQLAPSSDFSPNGDLLNSVYGVYDVKTGETVLKTYLARFVKFPERTLLAYTTGKDATPAASTTLHWWDPVTRKEVLDNGNPQMQSAAVLSPDGQVQVVNSESVGANSATIVVRTTRREKGIIFLNLETGMNIPAPPIDGWIRTAVLNSDSTLLGIIRENDQYGTFNRFELWGVPKDNFSAQ